MPPRARVAMLLRGCEAVEVEERADEPRRLAVEWITSEETERRTIRLEQLREKRHEPFVVHRRRHRREPHEPVEAEVVWSDLRRAALDVARLPLELVRAPLGRGCEDGIGGPFDPDPEPLLRDRAERAAGPNDMERIEARAHDLPPREQVSRGRSEERRVGRECRAGCAGGRLE